MKNIVISIGRQIGSGGKEIAELVADRLQIPVYDKKLLEVAAQESGLDTSAFEKADEKESSSFLGGIIALRDNVTSYFMGSSFDSDRLFQIQSEAIHSIAEKEACIIVGRCSEYVLRDHPSILSIFITADRNDRMERIMKKEKLDAENAAEYMEKGDKRRKSYHDYYAATEWGVASSYELCINSSRLGIQGTADFIVEYVRRRFGI